jgi:hypothetical protein
MEEYTDEQTGIRLTVERDYPVGPRITAFAPEGCTLTTEEANDAIRRLLVMAGLKQPGQAPPQQKADNA